MIGVNTSIFAPAGQSAGIGFAVPSATVQLIVPQLIRYGKVKRAGLGVRILPGSTAQRWRIEGVIVRDVDPGGAAQRAGLRRIHVDRWGNVRSFDVIVGVDDKSIRSYDDLYHALDGREAGEEVQVRVLREGRELSLGLVLQPIE